MFLKNYTSDVPVSQTIFRIEQVLIKCGVRGIEKVYAADMTVEAITFRIELEPGRSMIVRLPVDINRALDALWMDYAEGCTLDKTGAYIVGPWNCKKKKKRKDFTDQAERTAWKIIQDWVEVQMSMIQMKQADFREVFMPYLWDGRQTVFQRIRDGGFKALLPETTTP